MLFQVQTLTNPNRRIKFNFNRSKAFKLFSVCACVRVYSPDYIWKYTKRIIFFHIYLPYTN